MFQLNNLTPFTADRALITNLEGDHLLVVGVKATFDLKANNPPELAAVQDPVTVTPLFVGDDAQATMLRDVELTMDHDGTDVVVNGIAHAPGGKPTDSVLTSVKIDQIEAQAMVTGDRVWTESVLHVVPSDAQPFVTMPIIYERAFGGGHATDAGEVWDERNPIGNGYCEDPARLIGQSVPNVEDPNALIKRAKGRQICPVAGFASRPGSWAPRSALGGTYDDAWLKNRMPHWPHDLQSGFFRVAAPSLQSAKVFRGHEQVTLRNLTPEGMMQFAIPRVAPIVRVQMRQERVSIPVAMRRIIIEPSLGKLVLFWRATMNCGQSGRRVERISIDQKRIVRAGEEATIA